MENDKKRHYETKIFSVGEDIDLLKIPEEINKAAEDLRNGGLVIFPTETVYGLGANAFLPEAVKRIFEAKGRPQDNPLIVHIGDINLLDEIAGKNIPVLFWKLTEIFWPGPVTFILPKSNKIPNEVTGGQDSVGVRFPSNPVSKAFLRAAQVPVAAPSANLSGKPSPTQPSHLKEMMGRVDWIINSGELLFGLESTIISLLHTPPLLLRPGPITVEQLKKYIPDLIFNPKIEEGRIAPGMKYRHYSPDAELFLVKWNGDLQELVKTTEAKFRQINEKQKTLVLCSEETSNYYSKKNVSHITIGSRNDLFSVARNLYNTLRILDEMEYQAGIIEGYEEKGIGFALMNRIKKAVLKD